MRAQFRTRCQIDDLTASEDREIGVMATLSGFYRDVAAVEPRAGPRGARVACDRGKPGDTIHCIRGRGGVEGQNMESIRISGVSSIARGLVAVALPVTIQASQTS